MKRYNYEYYITYTYNNGKGFTVLSLNKTMEKTISNVNLHIKLKEHIINLANEVTNIVIDDYKLLHKTRR